MLAVQRLFCASMDFDQTWRAHSVALRSTVLIKSVSAEGEPLLRAALGMAQGFEPGFDAESALEDLLDEIQAQADAGFSPLRKNCLLGVCSSFENFAKTVATALSYDKDWRKSPEGKRLNQDTDADFYNRFATEDKRWKKGIHKYLRENFDWLAEDLVTKVSEVFWLRNQLTHNANNAREEKRLTVLDITFRSGDPIYLDGTCLQLCVKCLKDAVQATVSGTPYLEAI